LVDLRFARTEEQLDLNNPTFSAAIADIASPMRGVPKDELESEEVRQHRRTIRSAWAAGGVLVLLGILAAVAAVFAVGQRNEAQTQQAAAEESADFARSRELSASSLNAIGEDPELAILLSLASISSNPAGRDAPIDLVATLRSAISADRLLHVQLVDDSREWMAMDLSPDGTQLAVGVGGTSELRVYDTSTWEVSWAYVLEDDRGLWWDGTPVFSPDGDLVAIGFRDDPSVEGGAALLMVFEAETGEKFREVEFPESCEASVTPQGWSPDGQLLAVTVGPDCFDTPAFVDLVDTSTWEVVHEIETDVFARVVFAEAAERMVVIDYRSQQSPDRHAVVYDTASMEPIADFFASSGDIDPSGALFAGVNSDAGFVDPTVYRISDGQQIDRLQGLDFFPADLGSQFVEDGSVLVVGSLGQTTAVWEVESGELLFSLPSGPVSSLGYDEARDLLYTAGNDGRIRVWDLSSERTGLWFQADEFSVTDGLGSAMLWNRDPVTPSFGVFDPVTGQLGNTLIDEIYLDRVVSLPGSRVLYVQGDSFDGDQQIGPLAVWDASSGLITGVAGCWSLVDDPETCIEAGKQQLLLNFGLAVSADGSEFGAVDQGSVLHIWNSETLEEIETVDLWDQAMAYSQSDNGEIGGVFALESDWVIFGSNPYLVFSRITDEFVAELDIPNAGFTFEVSGDSSFLLADGNETELYRVETGTWTTRLLSETAEGTIRGLAISPSQDRVAVSAADGFVRILDTDTGVLLDLIPFDGVSDGHWLDSSHLVVGTGASGIWSILTIGTDQLVDQAVTQLTRGLTNEECVNYRIDSCPTLEDIRSGSA